MSAGYPLSRWADRRAISDHEADIGSMIAVYAEHMAALRLVAPLAIFPAIIGNHDVRVFNDLSGGYSAANLMHQLSGAGVLFVDKPDRENTLKITDSLVWAHGYRAMQDRRSSARNTL